MREGWTYKRLGEVCEVVSGSTPKTNIPEYWGEGHYWVTPAELNDSTVYVNKTDRQITDAALAKTNLQLLPVGTVLLSSRAPIGKVAITNAEMYCNQGFKNCICSDAIYNKYLFYYFKFKNDYLNSLGRGATFKEISKTIVESIIIPLPPFNIQQSIVAELDKINELIGLKKSQLSDLDRLAQSIFYEMFGDPVENEKGWEVKRLDALFKVTSSKRILQAEWQNEGVPFYKVADIIGLINQGKVFPLTFIKESTYNELKEQGLVPCKGDILITSRGTLGQCYIVAEKDKFYFQDGMITWLSQKANKIILPIFVKYIFGTKSFLKTLLHNANMSTVAYLSISHLAKKSIPLPPLPLQQSFAARIAAIEQQKQRIIASIKDLETLLALRMQYWFDG